MRILYLANNRTGLQVYRWLLEQGETIAGIVLHTEENRFGVDEILESVSSDQILLADELRTRSGLERIRSWNPDIGVSVLFGHILKPDVLRIPTRGVINLHPSFLPYNRGAYPNVWSIVDGTPAGVTIHHVDEGVDTGDIIAQRRTEVEPIDTGETLGLKLESDLVDLFMETWPQIKTGASERTPQDDNLSTSHRKRDVAKIDHIDLNRSYPARYLIDLLRARTYPPHESAYFEVDGRKVYLRLELAYADGSEGEARAV